jgi:hypothetical protein
LERRAVQVGKTHMTADVEGMARPDVDPGSLIGVHVSQCRFEPFEIASSATINHAAAAGLRPSVRRQAEGPCLTSTGPRG